MPPKQTPKAAIPNNSSIFNQKVVTNLKSTSFQDEQGLLKKQNNIGRSQKPSRREALQLFYIMPPPTLRTSLPPIPSEPSALRMLD
ncbi:MAG: hypothetical protein M1814_006110 [Vezdaea aestivalis]|nr:MAG: hypothetical protein M1814_006110 [Vezdaea aestivalis]